MKSKKILFLFAISQLIILIICLCVSLNTEMISYVFDASDFSYDSGISTEEGIYIDEEVAEESMAIVSMPVSLPKGTYEVIFHYEASKGTNTYSFLENGYSYYALEYDENVNLDLYNTCQTAYLNILTDVEQLQVNVLYGGEGTLSLHNVEITRTRVAEITDLITLLFVFIVIDLFLGMFLFNKQKESKSMFAPVVIIGLIASIPLFADYIIKGEGQDLVFHLFRIEGTKDALLSGQFPVRIHPTHFDGYGYPTGIYYPGLFLYIPALLRIMGFSIMDSYQIFIFIQNVATAAISYLCFKKMFGCKQSSFIGCTLYTLSLYRLINVYYRSAVGESLAMIFIPMVFLGLYLIINKQKEARWTGIMMLAFGFTGIIQSHVLSCEMTGIFCALICMLYIKKIFKEKRWLDILFSGVITIGLNLWFLLPFLQYMRLNIIIKQWEIRDITVFSLNPVQIFFPAPKVSGLAENLSKGVSGEMPYGIGFALVLGLLMLLSGFAKWYRKEKEEKQMFGILCFFLGILCLWMTTYTFPWMWIDQIGGVVARVMNMVQFPWRYLGLATVFLIVAILFYYKYLEEMVSKKLISYALVVISIFTTCIFAQQLFQNENMFRIYSQEGLSNLTFESTEYLYHGTDIKNIMDESDLIAQQTHITDYTKSGSQIDITVSNSTSNTIECLLPVFYYPCYSAYDVVTKEPFEVVNESNGNNILKILIPAGYQGDIRVEVKDSALWIFANILSGLTFIISMYILYLNCKNKKYM